MIIFFKRTLKISIYIFFTKPFKQPSPLVFFCFFLPLTTIPYLNIFIHFCCYCSFLFKSFQLFLNRFFFFKSDILSLLTYLAVSSVIYIKDPFLLEFGQASIMKTYSTLLQVLRFWFSNLVLLTRFLFSNVLPDWLFLLLESNLINQDAFHL